MDSEKRIKSIVDLLNEKDEKSQQEQEDRIKNLMTAFAIFQGTNGVYVAKFLKDFCLWDKHSLDVTPQVLAYQKGRRDVWQAIRSFVPKELLTQIEYD